MHFDSLPYKTKQFFFVLIKLSIVIAAFYLIYQKIIHNTEFNIKQFWSFLKESHVFSLKTIIFLLLLTGFNWFFEILKWQTLMRSITSISFKKALEQSLAALTASLLTPNRIGEYGAKAIYFRAGQRKQVMLLNLLGNVSQMATTLVFGSIGLWLMYLSYDLNINTTKLSYLMIIVVSILAFVAFGLRQTKFKIKGFSLEKLKVFFLSLSLNLHVYIIVLSLIRYSIFSFQFYVLLLLFGVDFNYLEAMTIITTMYLLVSVLPSIFIFDVVVKGSVAVYLFSLAGINAFTILSIVMIMWVLNFVLPSVFGSYYVLNFNLPKTDD
ncbi:lysylphosphatidylglycerol synthase domain-containing protein [Psychroserpens sp.]|uniref:lysylphosphatidylglycerol synthase domain-containing protein n=1 Tax=Psychroserpens sp. TaxID=2020870 RepID=UPI003C75F39C